MALAAEVAAEVPLDDLPVVQVFRTSDGDVVVKFDEYDAATAPLDRAYTNEPYNFRAINAGGREPRVKAFGSLLACSDGILTIGGTHYRIQAMTKQQNVAESDGPASKREAEQWLESLVIKHRIIESQGRPKRTLSYVSKSHAFSSLIVQNRVSFAEEFFFDLADPVSTDAFQGNGPDPSRDENKVHHPYFLKEMRKLIDSAVAAGQYFHQQLLWTKACHWLKLDDGISAGVEPDFSTVECAPNSLSGVVASSDKVRLPQSKYDVAIAFEQKKQFIDADQMEIIDYGERLLCIQRGRSRVYTALFHCALGEKVIRWAETSEVDGQFISKVTKPASLLPGCEGQRQLLTMLSKSSSDLGLDFPRFRQPVNGQSLKVLHSVGEGATSNVYAASLDAVDGVIKVMKNGFQHIAQQEKKILDHLKNGSGAVGLLNCIQVTQGVLFFDQLLRPFTGSFSRAHVAEILECLERVHAAGVVHRDIRPENIMEDAAGKVHLIDWGFALLERDVSALEPPPFEGTFRFGSEDVVSAAQNGTAHHYMPKDDLESFVKTVIAVNSGGQRLLRKAKEISPGDFGAALELWTVEQQAGSSSFSMIIEAARRNDYVELKKSLTY